MDKYDLTAVLHTDEPQQVEATTFHPEALVDSRHDIRLFFLLAGDEHEPLTLKLELWQLKHAPTFRAISYTWGNSDCQQTVSIDGRLCSVRGNCHYALWQTRLHYPNSYVFIDALSINQQDAQEKSAQVQIMGSIYATAQKVLACVGPHGDDSEFLVEFDPCQNAKWIEHAGSNTHDIYQQVRARGFDYCKRFWHAYRAFCQRPYWNRLWIVQELAVACDKQVLCGNQAWSWHIIHVIMYCQAELPENYADGDDVDAMWFEDPLWNVGHWAKVSDDNFANVLLTFGGQRCEDPRDHIYGLSTLIKWSDSLPPIIANYTTSSFELAIQASEHLEVNYWLHLLSALKIDIHYEEMLALSKARRLRDVPFVEIANGRRHRPARTSFGQHTFTVLQENLGFLTCPVNLNSDDEIVKNPDLDLFRQRQSGSDLKYFQNYKPKELVVGDQIIGLLCHRARAGDILMSFHTERRDLCIILRPHNNSPLEIVGQAVLLNGHTIKGRYIETKPANRYEYRGTLTMNLSVEDILVLLGQDLIADESLFSQNAIEPPLLNADQWVQRPLTRVHNRTINPAPQAWVHDVRRHDTKDRRELESVASLDSLLIEHHAPTGTDQQRAHWHALDKLSGVL